MKMILVGLPVLALVTLFLLGVANLRKAFAAFLIWGVLCIGIYFYALVTGIQSNNPGVFVFAPIFMIVAALPIFWIALIVSLFTKPTRPAPVVQIAQAYQGLSDVDKGKLHTAVQKGAPIVARGLATYLEKKGWSATAGALRETSQLL